VFVDAAGKKAAAKGKAADLQFTGLQFAYYDAEGLCGTITPSVISSYNTFGCFFYDFSCRRRNLATATETKKKELSGAAKAIFATSKAKMRYMASRFKAMKTKHEQMSKVEKTANAVSAEKPAAETATRKLYPGYFLTVPQITYNIPGSNVTVATTVEWDYDDPECSASYWNNQDGYASNSSPYYLDASAYSTTLTNYCDESTGTYIATPSAIQTPDFGPGVTSYATITTFNEYSVDACQAWDPMGNDTPNSLNEQISFPLDTCVGGGFAVLNHYIAHYDSGSGHIAIQEYSDSACQSKSGSSYNLEYPTYAQGPSTIVANNNLCASSNYFDFQDYNIGFDWDYSCAYSVSRTDIHTVGKAAPKKGKNVAAATSLRQ